MYGSVLHVGSPESGAIAVRIVLAMILLAGCNYVFPLDAHDQVDGGADASSFDQPDSATPTDVSGTLVTLREASSDTVGVGSAVFCSGGSATERGSSWYRAFRPADFGATGTFHITQVNFATESAQGGQPLGINLYTYAGTAGTMLDGGSFAPLAQVSGTVADAALPADHHATIAADVDAQATFVVALSSSDHYSSGVRDRWLHLGANTASQTAPSYYSSGECGINTIASQAVSFVISVEGSY